MRPHHGGAPAKAPSSTPALASTSNHHHLHSTRPTSANATTTGPGTATRAAQGTGPSPSPAAAAPAAMPSSVTSPSASAAGLIPPILGAAGAATAAPGGPASPRSTRAGAGGSTSTGAYGTSVASAGSSASSGGAHAAPGASATSGVLKRLRQILWEGVSRMNEGDGDTPPPPADTSPSSATANLKAKPATGATAPTAGRQPVQQLSHEHLLKEALKRMTKNHPMQTRLVLVNELCEYARTYLIEDVLTVWAAVKDLVGEDQPPYVRKIGYDVMLALIEGQYAHLGPLRIEFFAIICNNTHNFVARLTNLIALTKNGHSIAPFEHELCQLLLAWLERGKYFTLEIIKFASNVIKYNPYSIAQAPKTALICFVCDICNTASEARIVESCLNFFDVLVRYSHVPERALIDFINALCRTLNIEAYCQTSWSLITNLLKSPCGHQAVIALCSILGDKKNYHAVNLLRGAVFYLSMACWGSQRISTLSLSRSTVLSYILRVLESKHNIVAYEVALSVNRLIKKYGVQMHVEWDLVIQIMRNLLPYLMGHEYDGQYSLVFAVRESLEIMHVLNKNLEFIGPTEELIELLEDFSTFCLEETAIDLIMEKRVMIHPASHKWQHHLRRFLFSHFQREARPSVQLKAISVLEQVFRDFHALYGDEILTVTLPIFNGLYASGSVLLASPIYKRGLDFLVSAASATRSKKFFEVVDVIYKASRGKHDRQRYDAIAALIKLFVKKFPNVRHTHTLYIFEQLRKLAQDHHPTLRAKVIVLLLSFRANSRYSMQLHVYRPAKPAKAPESKQPDRTDALAAMADPSKSKSRTPVSSPRGAREAKEGSPGSVKQKATQSAEPTPELVPETLTSPYLVCWRSQRLSHDHHSEKTEKLGLFPVGSLMDALITAIQNESTYEVFIVIVRGLIEMLKNYYILRSADMCSIASVVCKLLRSGTFGACIDLSVRSDKAVRGRILEIGYELLVSLIGYQAQLKPKYREYIISALCEGLTANLLSIPPNFALAVQRTCINGLSIGLSELPESMSQRISAIVGDMYKVCERNFESKRHMQIPEVSELARHVLEFFSFLLDAPTIISCLKDDDRQRLFLTLMLLTNPQEFAPHVANQAYVVWADFFMESPVHLRLGYYRTAASYLMQKVITEPPRGGSPVDANLLLMATLDLFAQSVFGNCEGTPLPPSDAFFLFENSPYRKWTQGNCIITMRVGKMGWVEIVVRRAAGSQRWIMQIQNMIYQVPAPANVLKTDEQLKRCMEEAPWMFTYLQVGDSLLGRTKRIPDRAASDTPIKRQLPQGLSRSPVTPESRDPGSVGRKRPTRKRKKRSLSAPLLREKPLLLELDAEEHSLEFIPRTSYPRPEIEPIAQVHKPVPRAKTSASVSSPKVDSNEQSTKDNLAIQEQSNDTAQREQPDTGSRVKDVGMHSEKAETSKESAINDNKQPIPEKKMEQLPLRAEAAEESRRGERKWTDTELCKSVTSDAKATTEQKGKERMDHLRKKFISKVGGPPVKITFPEDKTERLEDEPSISGSSIVDMQRRRSWSEPDLEEAGNALHKTRRAHRRHASTVELSLSVLYPPLPSYEGSQEDKSPPLFIPPKHGSDTLLWKRGRCVSHEHVNLTKQTLSLEGQMFLHSMSSSPKSLEEPPLLLRTSPPTINLTSPSGNHTQPKPGNQFIGNQIRRRKTEEQIPEPTIAQQNESEVPRSLSLEFDEYTPPDAATALPAEESALSLEKEMQSLLPPEFDISPPQEFPHRYSSAQTETTTTPTPSTTPAPQAPNDGFPMSPTGRSSTCESSFKKHQSDSEKEVSTSAHSADGTSSKPEEASVTAIEKEPPRITDRSPEAKEGKGNIRKEKDELVLLGDGLISPSPGGIMLHNLESDEEATELPPEKPSSFSEKILAAEKLEGVHEVTVSTPKPSGATKSRTAKERSTSILQLFSSPGRKVQSTPSKASTTSHSPLKPFKIPSTRFDNHPSFVYSQIKNIPFIDDSAPRELKSNDDALARALSILDRTPTTVCVKVGIIYVGEDQHTEEQILANTAGSPRYYSLLNRLGSKLELKDTPMYAGGLDTREKTDGNYTIHWRSVSTQMVFHVVTLIPNQLQLYPQFQNKKRHIGNDNVNIVYTDSPREFIQDTIPGQFNFVHIVVHPLKEGFYRVEIKKKPQVPSFGPITNVQIVSERAMATLVRQVALSANLAACLVQDPHLQRYSNLEERLRQLRKIGERFAKTAEAAP